MMKRFAILAAALFALLVPAMAFADGGVNATLRVERDAITVGDWIPLRITVTHPQNWRVIFPALDKTWGDLEVRAQNVPQINQAPDGTETTTQVIQVTRFRPGAVTTPELVLGVADDQGQVHTVSVAPVTLQVQSVLQPNDTQLRDIKPQAELWQLSSSPLPFLASVALASLLVGSAAFWAWKHRPWVDKRTPRERALDELKALDAMNLLQAGDAKTYCVRVAVTLRDYLAAGCAIPTHDLTTGELARALQDKQVPVNTAAQIIHALRVCDAAKFANDASDADTLNTLTNTVRQIVAAYPPAPVAPIKRRHFAFGARWH